MTKTRNKGPIHSFKSAWWSVELPSGWIGSEDPECVTFRATPPLGALQLSAALKDGGSITEEDLQSLVKESPSPRTELVKVSYGSFFGVAIQYVKEGLFWREWWLASGRLMIYATYNVAKGGEDLEEDKIESILSSLSSTGHHAFERNKP